MDLLVKLWCVGRLLGQRGTRVPLRRRSRYKCLVVSGSNPGVIKWGIREKLGSFPNLNPALRLGTECFHTVPASAASSCAQAHNFGSRRMGTTGRGKHAHQARQAARGTPMPAIKVSAAEPTEEQISALVAHAARPRVKISLPNQHGDPTFLASRWFVDRAMEVDGCRGIAGEPVLVTLLALESAAASVCTEANRPLIRDLFVSDGATQLKDKRLVKLIEETPGTAWLVQYARMGTANQVALAVLAYLTASRWKAADAIDLGVVFRHKAAADGVFRAVAMCGMHFDAQKTGHVLPRFPTFEVCAPRSATSQ